MQFATFAEYAREAEAASADSDIRERVTELLLEAESDLPVVARYVQGRVFPAHDSTKLDVGPALCYAAIAKAAGRNVDADDVETSVADVGEVGEVAASYDFGAQQGLGAFTGGDRGGGGGAGGGSDSLTIAEVDDSLRELAAVEGAGSEDTKRDVLFGLFNRASEDEARYLARLVLGEMRIGVGGGTVRDAVAEAFEVPAEGVERALQVTNDHGQVAVVARDEGEAGLDALGLEVGRPVDAMLAQAGTVTEALADWERAAVEWKYDGARVQVHYDGTEATLFSRNMEDVTDPLPEVVEFVEGTLDAPAILDGEVVAVADDGSPLPFQEILRRFRRKHDVAQAREDVAVEFHAFDCLHADGEDLLGVSLTERHDRLTELLADRPDAVSDLVVAADAEAIEDIESAALSAGHEGIMLKNPGSAYTPGRRGKNWLKRKPDVETLDLVVTGAEWGEGRRANVLGTFLLSVRGDSDGIGENGEAATFETIGKVATGITDEELDELTDLLEPHVRSQDGAELDVEPAVVFEVGYEEIQPSPTYSSGYALRFPRFLGVRDDKDPDDADSVDRVQRLADRQ